MTFPLATRQMPQTVIALELAASQQAAMNPVSVPSPEAATSQSRSSKVQTAQETSRREIRRTLYVRANSKMKMLRQMTPSLHPDLAVHLQEAIQWAGVCLVLQLEGHLTDLSHRARVIALGLGRSGSGLP